PCPAVIRWSSVIVTARSSFASDTVLQMPVTSSRVDCISSCLMRGCSPVSEATGSSSSSFPASWRSSLVSLSISWTSHSTPSVAPREGFHSIAMPGPFVLCLVIRFRGADTRPRHRAARRRPHREWHRPAARHRLFGSLVPQPGQPGRLCRLERRILAQRLIGLLAVGDKFVHANDNTLALVDFPCHLVRRGLDLGFLETLLDRGG